jgi:hypothetical protein
VDCGGDTDIFYLTISEGEENIIDKYDITGSNDYLGRNKIYFKTEAGADIDVLIDVEGDYLGIRYEFGRIDGELYQLWIKDKLVANLFIQSRIIDKKTFECCSSSDLETIQSRTDSVIVIEVNENLYEIQY